MGQTLVYKILEKHLVEGKLAAGERIGIHIDQTLTQDATGTTAYLLYESMGIGAVKTDLSVSYVDHNMAGFGPENHNDHLYLQTVAAKSGAYHSGLATEFATRFISKDSENLALLFLAAIHIPQQTAVSECSPSAQAVSTSRSQWRAGRSI